MAQYVQTLRQFNRDVRLYVLAWALIGFGFFGVQGVLFNLYLLRLGYDAQFIGLFSSAGLLVWALCTVPAGVIGRRIGNRNALIAGMTISAGANALVLLVEGLPVHLQVDWLVGWWLFRWLGTALAVVNSTPYLTGITCSEERKHAFSSQQAAMAVSAFLGSVVAGVLPGFLADRLGLTLDAPAPYRIVLWSTPIFYVAAILVLFRTRAAAPAATHATAQPDGPRPLKLIVLMGVVVFLSMVGQGTVRAFFNIYLDAELQIPTAWIGTLMGVGQLLPIVAALVAPLFMVRWGAGRTLSAAIAGVAASLLVLAFIPHWLGAGLAFIGVTAMAAIAGPARNLFSQESVTPAWRTDISTATAMGNALGWSAAAWTGGALLSVLDYSGLFGLGAILTAAAAGLLQGYLLRHRDEPSVPVASGPAQLSNTGIQARSPALEIAAPTD